MIVVDASAALELLLRPATHERLVERLLGTGKLLVAPHLLDLEVVQVLRRFAATVRAITPCDLLVLDGDNVSPDRQRFPAGAGSSARLSKGVPAPAGKDSRRP